MLPFRNQETLHLSSYTDDDDDDDDLDTECRSLSEPDVDLEADYPLVGSHAVAHPRWLSPRSSRFWSWDAVSRWIRSVAQLVRQQLFVLSQHARPRLAWRYLLCLAPVLYAFYCGITSQPLFASNLPPYSGPHAVGTIDLEVPLSKSILISNTTLTATGEPAFEVESVLFSVYYPTTKGSTSKKHKHPWAARPLSLTAEGFTRIAHVDNFIMRPIFTFALWALVGFINIPAEVDVPLLGVDDEKPEKFPIMVFSHGMASSRTDYTHYLGELASRGNIVAAIEHRDGSCPGSIVKIRSKKDRNVLLLRESDLVSDPPMTTPQIKREQLAFRDAEILETIRVLQDINAGDGASIFHQSSRSEGETLASWTNRLDTTRLTIGGHSYGATGALQALSTVEKSSIPSIGGIVLDPGKESGPLNADIPVPILVVQSNSWSRSVSPFFGRTHFDTVRDLVLDALNRTGASWFLTSLETAHPSVTDAPLIEPMLLRWTTGATVDVKDGLKEYVKVTMDFFSFLKSGETDGVLGEAVTHEEYGVWVSEERKKSIPKAISKHWEVHVSPK